MKYYEYLDIDLDNINSCPNLTNDNIKDMRREIGYLDILFYKSQKELKEIIERKIMILETNILLEKHRCLKSYSHDIYDKKKKEITFYNKDGEISFQTKVEIEDPKTFEKIVLGAD